MWQLGSRAQSSRTALSVLKSAAETMWAHEDICAVTVFGRPTRKARKNTLINYVNGVGGQRWPSCDGWRGDVLTYVIVRWAQSDANLLPIKGLSILCAPSYPHKSETLVWRWLTAGAPCWWRVFNHYWDHSPYLSPINLLLLLNSNFAASREVLESYFTF